MIGSLMYLTAFRPDIMFAVYACANFQVTPKTSHLHAMKRIFRYLKGQPKLGLWYPRDSSFDLEAFLDSDYAGASLDRKSTTGGCQFLAEYVAVANYCGQVLWIQNQMLDYRFNFMNTKIYIDNESTICIVKNPVFHSKTKHIEIRHHFIRDSYKKKLIQVIKIHTDHNVADLLIKDFDVISGPIHLVANEIVYKEWEDRMERAATTTSRLESEQEKCLNQIRYALTVNPTIYTSCIEQFWATAKVKTVNGERQLQALVDKKKVIITETSIKSDLNLEDACGTDCLPTDTIFEELARMGVLALETTKTTQALEIASLKSRVKKLEKKASKRTHKFKRLYRVGTTRRVESSNDEGLGAQEDASKQGRSIEDIDKDAEVSLVDETQGRSDDTEMFDTDALIGDEVFAKNDMTKKEHDVIPKEVSAAETLTTVGIKILVSTIAPSTTAVSPPVITEVEITLAQTLAELKSAKSKVVIQEPVQSTVTTAPSTIPKAKGITFRDAGETTTRTPTSVSSSSIKDKGKAKMVEPEVPLNKKDQIRLDEELVRRLDVEEQEIARLERENVELQEQATLAKIEEWDNVQAMMDADYELCKRLQDEKKAEGSRNKSIGKKKAGNEQKQESSKRQRMKDDKETDKHEEVEEDDEAEMKKHMEIVLDKEEIAIDDIPLATKPPMIVEYKIVKEGQKGFYHLIRADGSSKRYSSMIKMLQNIDREYLKTLWKLVKAKHRNIRPDDDYERVFWGDLKVMFELDIKSKVWRSLQGYKVTI
ncbi:hypothetical protein Tco_0601574 [Tanacetum coccineum]